MSDKIYEIPAEWTKRAFITEAEYKKMYASSLADPNGFWAEQAKRIHWMKHFSKVKNTSFAKDNVSIKWFEDGATNVAYNCIDRHLHTQRPPDRDHLGRRRSERFQSTSPTSNCTTRSAASPISCATATSRKATASPSTCR